MALDGGWVKIHRSILDSAVFKTEEEAMAFAWLVVKAAWKETKVRYKDRILTLDRGQLALSSRDFSSHWSWSEAKCRRFINRLKSDAVVDAHSDAGVTLITICNYDKYQAILKTDDAPSDAPVTQDRRTEQEEKKLRKDNTGYSPEFEEAWADYPKRSGSNPKRTAYKAWQARLKQGFTAEQLAEGVRRYAEHLRSSGKLGSVYVKQASTFFGPDEHFLETYGEKPKEETNWRMAVEAFVKFNVWPAWAPGPAPDQPGCKCPDEILREFGLRRAA